MKIGVDYYPEHWDINNIKSDINLMRKTGVKLVRLAEFAWCRLEPAEGVYDFKWLDDAIELFGENDIQIVLGTPTCTPPLWLYEKYPYAIQVDKNGNRSFTGIRGHRCFNSPSMRKFTNLIVEKMTKHYANSKVVIGWQIDNELEANNCCCEHCSNKFREWLKNKYGTLETMNKEHGNVVWSGEYTSWEQVKPPLGGSPHLNPSYLLDFDRYAADSTVEYVKFQLEIIRRNCPKHFVTTNTWFPYYIPNFHKTFKELDFVSYDNYPTTKVIDNKDSLHSHAFHCDLMRGIKRQNFWIMEQLSGPLGCWMPMTRTTKPGMIKGYSFQAIAHGADTVVHFRWRNATIGAEMFWHGLIDHSNVPGRRFNEFAELCNDVNKISAELRDSVIKNEVAILYSSEQEYAFKIQPQVQNMYYLEQLQLFHQSLLRLGVGADIIDWSEDLSSYKIVIAPTLYITNETVTKNLYSFVKAGGTLILTNRTGVKYPNNTCVMKPLPGDFAECAGIVVTEYDPLGEDKLTVKSYNNKTYECTQWCDLIEPTTAKVIATYNDDFFKGTAAVTVNNYKSGKVYYLGTVFSRDYYYDLMSQILKDNNIKYYTELEDDIELSVRENDNGKYLFIFNNSNKLKTFKAKSKYRSIINDTVYGQTFELKPYGTDVLKECK
ncbi:beta-galactosidase [Inconstantimicrobium mannanitabidum]|uniref:Beta-galactosidase n=1 Tax=Inconstantimicrobium mannanitabidum TaxID=1604901 RepID=A0ACB5R793_9CLOT|nr:beta-galactosidase [Clostridium sp. TW13]GKX65058.1 beta-galactosidase [Clostridium sp. TW13]